MLEDIVKTVFNKTIKSKKTLNSFLDLISLNDGFQFIVKTGANVKVEGEMLEYLSKYITTAKVYYFDSDYLFLEYIENRGRFSEKDFAKDLATMHLHKFDYFGFEQNTTIGPYLQKNNKSHNWINFFKQERLLYMARECYKEHKISKALLEKIENFSNSLENYLMEPAHPSLLHGDIWGGNVLSKDSKAILIDPAIYYGHYEMELAFITLFHTFGNTFFNEYNNYLPVEKEFFTVRKDIYNLYPLLVHVRSFGDSYRYEVEGILKRFHF